MPIYEFDCGACGRDSELLVRSSKWQGTKCPHCGSTKLRKRLSVFAAASASSVTAPACGTGSCPMMNPRSSAAGGCCGARPHH
ncbi:zinc ribbon domain-containing protein [bacterium]|nr:zinc ribbon domain-containing protein [bacterium]